MYKRQRYILPGFTDTHNHLLAAGRSIETLDLGDARSIDEMIGKGRHFLAENDISPDGWFFARGWDQNHMAENRFPNRFDLDLISTDIPLFFERSCGHIAALNSRALEILKICLLYTSGREERTLFRRDPRTGCADDLYRPVRLQVRPRYRQV